MKHKAGILLSLLAFLIVNASSLEAAIITVNSLSDTVSNGDGNCILREAIVNANANLAPYSDCAAGSGADTIRFSVSGTITLGSALPGMSDPLGLTIDGTGQAVTITRTGTAAIYINNINPLTLNNLTFANCSNTSLPSGGAIMNNGGNLTINNCTFSDNGTDSSGGAIFTNGATLTVTNSIFTRNSAGNGDGGGICSTGGTLTVTNSTFIGNFARYDGGGIANGGTATITGSTIAYNDAGTDGGGFFNTGTGTANLTNVTISSNEADVIEGNDSGGGIYNNGTLNMTNVTIANNIANSSQGDGIYNAGTATLLNTLIANNNDQNCAGAGTLNATYSLSSDSTCFSAVSGNVINPNPLIGPLANNGGPTETLALLAGSPAINTANPSSFPPTDQRGITRPQGAGADIGAYEYQMTAIPTMNEWGMIIFMVLAGLGSIYYLRRQRKA